MKIDNYNKAENIQIQIKRLEEKITELNSILDADDRYLFDARIQESYDRVFSMRIPKKFLKKILGELREDALRRLTFLDEEFKEL